MNYILMALMTIYFPSAIALEKFSPSLEGDHYVFIPPGDNSNLLIVAHGTIGKNETANQVAHRFLARWKPYATENNAILIVPVFDTHRFGNQKGGYGGYRNLLGKYIAADEVVNQLADKYSKYTVSNSNQFYLYGHSAGGQFVSRYSARHPDRIVNGVISAAGRYSYPTKASKWPYGAAYLKKKVSWSDGFTQHIRYEPDLANYAKAAQVLSVVIGSKDTSQQPKRPSHTGNNRIDFAQTWAIAMNRNALDHGVRAKINVHIVDGVGHDSAALTPTAATILFDKSEP
jgi:pimeloyl-ACP methyl ester carboxylesterase